MSKEILQQVLGPARVKELWTSACRLVLPLIPQDFSIGGVLPAVIYMLRWDRRRGQGNFERVFGNPNGRRTAERAATITCVVRELYTAS